MPLEFRIALTIDDYDKAKAFYQEALGLPIVEEWDNKPGRGVILDAGKATLELFDPPQADMVDQIEAGARLSGVIRFAIHVESVEATRQTLEAAGATVIHDPVLTPWGDFNQRIQAPDGMQITLYQKKEE